MAISVKERFEVTAPIAEVWAYFDDPPQVVPCLPGAELVKAIDENTYEGRVSFQVGPVRAQFAGTVKIENRDPAQHAITLAAKGTQQGAIGRAEAQVSFGLQAVDETLTEVTIDADVSITGKLAQLGGGMIQTVSRQIFRKFADCVQKEFVAAGAD